MVLVTKHCHWREGSGSWWCTTVTCLREGSGSWWPTTVIRGMVLDPGGTPVTRGKVVNPGGPPLSLEMK